LGANISAVTVDDARDGCKADSRTLVFISRMEACKRPKELTGIGHIESGPIVAHVEFAFAIFANPNLRMRRMPCKFPGIA
jgi:hypothetical protein